MAKAIASKTVDKINKLNKQGYSGKVISEKLGICRATVSNYTIKLNVHPRVDAINEPDRIESRPNRSCNDRLEIFKLGTKLIITEKTRAGSETGGNKIRKNIRKGTVMFTNDWQFVVKFKNHRGDGFRKEGFKYSDILVEDIEVRKIN